MNYSKTNSSCASIFVQEVLRINLLNFGHLIKWLFQNTNKNLNRHPLAFKGNCSKTISNLQRNHMGSFTIKFRKPTIYFWWCSKRFNWSNFFLQKYLNRHYFAFIQNEHEVFSKLHTRMMGSFYIEEAFQLNAFHNFKKCLSAPNSCFPNIALIGIILPLIKVQIKLFKNPKQMVGWAWKFHELSNKTNFIKFGIHLIPQLIVLLQ